MASIGKAFKKELVGFLLASAPLASAIGNRLYALRAQQNTVTPFVVWQSISAFENYSHAGAFGIEEHRIQFSIFSNTLATCEEIRDLIKDRIGGYRGLLQADVFCAACFFENEIDTDSGLSTELRQKTIDFRFMVKAYT